MVSRREELKLTLRQMGQNADDSETRVICHGVSSNEFSAVIIGEIVWQMPHRFELRRGPSPEPALDRRAGERPELRFREDPFRGPCLATRTCRSVLGDPYLSIRAWRPVLIDPCLEATRAGDWWFALRPR
jgi:hypothetical protein